MGFPFGAISLRYGVNLGLYAQSHRTPLPAVGECCASGHAVQTYRSARPLCTSRCGDKKPFPVNATRKGQTPPDLVVKFQHIEIVELVLWLVLRPRIVHQREIKG